MLRVDKNAFNRAHLDALRHLKVPDAFGTQLGRDVIKLGTRVNRAVWAYGLANIAVHALVGDEKGHKSKQNGIGGAYRLLVLCSGICELS